METSIIIHLSPDELKSMIGEAVEEKFQALRSPNKEQLLTRKEAAALLRISVPMLFNLTKSGEIPGHRLGDRVLYKESELINALKQIKTSKNRIK